MTKKKTGIAHRALVAVERALQPVTRPMNGTGAPVHVDAVYEVRELRPSGDGPWTGEAEKIAWTDEMSGYACIIRRAPQGGHLCGYVAVPPGHPLFGMDPYAFVGLGIGVHGGLSYASECQRWEPEARSICHVTTAGTRKMRDQAEARAMREQLVHANAEALRHDDAWWLGFECNQPGDVSPSGIGRHAHDEHLQGSVERTYKTEAFVYDECVRLAAQLKAIEEARDARDADPGPSVSRHDQRRMGR